MIAAAFLLITGPCADYRFCPTQRQFERAFAAWSRQPSTPSMQKRVASITNILCGGPDPVDRSITCRATFHYAKERKFQFARLTRTNKEWKVEESYELTSISQP